MGEQSNGERDMDAIQRRLAKLGKAMRNAKKSGTPSVHVTFVDLPYDCPDQDEYDDRVDVFSRASQMFLSELNVFKGERVYTELFQDMVAHQGVCLMEFRVPARTLIFIEKQTPFFLLGGVRYSLYLHFSARRCRV